MDGELKKHRYHPETETLLKQFQKYANMGDKATFNRRYDFTFWPEPRQRATLQLMDEGMSFEEAFDRMAGT